MDSDCDQHTRGGLVFLAYAVEREDLLFPASQLPGDNLARSQTQLLDDSVCAAVQVYNGETSYCDARREGDVRRLLPDSEAKFGAEKLVEMRGMIHMLAYSTLEDIIRG